MSFKFKLDLKGTLLAYAKFPLKAGHSKSKTKSEWESMGHFIKTFVHMRKLCFM